MKLRSVAWQSEDLSAWIASSRAQARSVRDDVYFWHARSRLWSSSPLNSVCVSTTIRTAVHVNGTRLTQLCLSRRIRISDDIWAAQGSARSVSIAAAYSLFRRSIDLGHAFYRGHCADAVAGRPEVPPWFGVVLRVGEIKSPMRPQPVWIQA